jgi:inner membrane protease ATP23
MLEAIIALGCEPKADFFKLNFCDGQINGGFNNADDGPEVVLCHNHLKTQDSVDQTITHELIHAYDQCRAKIDWTNCDHHACSEVSLGWCLAYPQKFLAFLTDTSCKSQWGL